MASRKPVDPIQQLAAEVGHTGKELSRLLEALQAERVPAVDVSAELSQSLRGLQGGCDKNQSEFEQLMSEISENLSGLETTYHLLRGQLEPVTAEYPEAKSILGSTTPADYRGTRLTYGLAEIAVRVQSLNSELETLRSNLVI